MLNTAEWIIVIFLAVALLMFLICGIILLIKLIGVANEAKRVIITSQGIAEKADDIVDNVKDLTSVGGLVKTFVNRYNGSSDKRKKH